MPESNRNEILRVGHATPLSGHMGNTKTSDTFWPGLSSDVRQYCDICPQCHVTARKLMSQRSPLKPVVVVTEPFKKIIIDVVGEL